MRLVRPTRHARVHEMLVQLCLLRGGLGGGLPGSQVLALCLCLWQVTGSVTATSAPLCGQGPRLPLG